MAQDPLPDSVRNLILTKIPSVLQLEVLLQLYAARPRYLTIREIAQTQRVDRGPLLDQLRVLASHGLAADEAGSEPAFSYAGASPEQDQAVADLAVAYAARPVTVISLIYSRPEEQMRTFADSFRLRQERQDKEPRNE